MGVRKFGLAAIVAGLVSGLAVPTGAQQPQEAQAPGTATLELPPAISVDRERLSTPSEPFACPFCDLRGADLAGENLTNANLQGANLEGANLSGADLDGAMLAGANLSGASLVGASLDRSEKGHADLAGANLDSANLAGASLNGTDLQYADLRGVDRTEVDLTRALMPAVPTLTADARIACGKANLTKLQTRIYVATTGTDTGTCGTAPDNACATIATGISRCSTGASCGVLVMWGEYKPSATIALADGIDVYGGCTTAATDQGTMQSLIEAPGGGQPAMSASGISNAGAVLQGFRLQGSAAQSPLGTASVALTVTNSSKLSVIDTRILAGAGAPGRPGDDGGSGTEGARASGASAGSVAACPGSAGGNGSVTMDVSVEVHGLKLYCTPSCSANACWGFSASAGTGGGQWGNSNCAECPISHGDTGHGGNSGGNGGCGQKGSASGNRIGSFNGPVWQASVGGDATAGSFGSGGGGGGSGGYRAGWCFFVKTENPGNRGGGGGAGGCGGAPGRGGQQGGGSFAVSLFGSPLTLTDSAVVGGLGGTGGKGGNGGSGGSGGAGAGGLTDHDGGGRGGTGGAGGNGGGGGGGAGGNGGPAVGIALVGGSNVSDSGTIYYTGRSGSPGGNGTGGAPVRSGVCTGPNGDQGNAGVAADKQTY